MKRKITGFHQDELQDWVADLECFHGQHVRHKPPFFNRPWTQSGAGRASMLGIELDCVRCDRLEWPEGLVVCGRSPDFTAQTVPAALLETHALEVGTWGRIHLIAGSLSYTLQNGIPRTFALHADAFGIIPPGITHHLTVKERVIFYVEFFSRPKPA
jgi:tellurite resistance-related uncharacterized protein